MFLRKVLAKYKEISSYKDILRIHLRGAQSQVIKQHNCEEFQNGQLYALNKLVQGKKRKEDKACPLPATAGPILKSLLLLGHQSTVYLGLDNAYTRT